MKRRSVFADKLTEFESFVLGDAAVTTQRGRWHQYFRSRRAGPAPLAGDVGAGGTRNEDGEAGSSSNLHPLLLEIGCFDARFLAHIAVRHPDRNFIGLDWKARPLYLGAREIVKQDLRNLALLRGRAQDLASIFADGELDEVWLLHPEPCDREKERANRLMSEPFLMNVHRLLRRGGRLILKTDHREYFDSTLGLLREPSHAGQFVVEVESSDFWNDPAAQCTTADLCLSGERTFYEARFIRRKLPICYLQIRHA